MSQSYLVRLEARHRASDLRAGLSARVADPLWMLGRQWQWGELLGEDAGSPTAVDVAAETALVDNVATPSGGTRAYDPGLQPLDALMAERQREASGWTARLRVDTGRAFTRALREAGLARHVAAFVGAYRLAPADEALRQADPAGARLLDVTACRVPDGEALYAAWKGPLRRGVALPAAPPVAAADETALRTAGRAWLAFCDATAVDTGQPTWQAERLAHVLALSAGTTTLQADDWRGTPLDWHAFDLAGPSASAGFKPLPPPAPLPTGIRFRGMPNSRWWEFEDAGLDNGAIDAGPSDVARLAFVEFALVYANDYFAVPLKLPVGSLTRIRTLEVKDTFGLRLRIPAAGRTGGPGAAEWSMYRFTQRAPDGSAAGRGDLLFLPPVAVQPIAGSPIEDVLMLRDEMANIAWAIERRFPGQAGRGVEAQEAATRQLDAPPVPAQDTPLRYRLGTSVPPYWFPLLPLNSARGLYLKLEIMADSADPPSPRGRILEIGSPPILDAEVTREGCRLHREHVMARWSDGSTLSWIRRVRGVGRGEGSSGLRFDMAAPLDTNG
jgi:hypothetical protein